MYPDTWAPYEKSLYKPYITWVFIGEKNSQESLGSTIDLAYCPLIPLVGRSEKPPPENLRLGGPQNDYAERKMWLLYRWAIFGTNLEPVWTLFWGFNPPKQGLSNQN